MLIQRSLFLTFAMRWGTEMMELSYLYSDYFRDRVSESLFSSYQTGSSVCLSNCHPLGINMNQAKKSLPAQFSHLFFYGLVNACRELYIHLFNSKLGKHFLVSSNWLKMIIFKVVSCYESETCFQKMSAVLVYQWCQISMYFIVYFTPWLRHVGKKNTNMYTICLLTSQQ